MKPVLMAGTLVALVAVLLMSSSALAKGPDGAAQSRTQTRARDDGQAAVQVRAQSQERVQVRQADVVGVQVPSVAQVQNGDGHGAGDGTGPIIGGSFGPGPNGKCLDVDNDGICDCRE